MQPSALGDEDFSLFSQMREDWWNVEKWKLCEVVGVKFCCCQTGWEIDWREAACMLSLVKQENVF